MIYSNEKVRRQNRLLNIEEATEILKNGEYGYMSMYCQESGAYGIPISYVWNSKESIYLHCAPEGKKLRCLDKQNQVSFCVVGKTQVIPNKFTTLYESIILQCEAHRNLPEEERMEALHLILKKFSPDDLEKGMKYAENSFGRTEIIRLDIREWSGKGKK